MNLLTNAFDVIFGTVVSVVVVAGVPVVSVTALGTVGGWILMMTFFSIYFDPPMPTLPPILIAKA